MKLVKLARAIGNSMILLGAMLSVFYILGCTVNLISGTGNIPSWNESLFKLGMWFILMCVGFFVDWVVYKFGGDV